MFGKSKLELKLGIFVFIGLTILVILVLSIGNFRTWHKGYNVYIQFGFINGVKIGAPVRYAGVDVGEVKEIDIIVDRPTNVTTVKLKAWLSNETKIPIDSTVWVNTLGLLGEKYIEIMPGKDYSVFFRPEQTIMGNSPIAMHEVTQIAKDVATDLKEAVGELELAIERLNNEEGTMGKLFYDDRLYNDLAELVADIKQHPWKLLWKSEKK